MATSTFQAFCRHAGEQMASRNWDGARAAWLEALPLAPDPAQVLLELSYVESLAGRYRAAHAWTMRAVGAKPRSVEGLLSLLQRLRTFNEAAVVHGIAAGLLGNPRIPPQVLVECARQLSNLNDFGLALDCARAAVARAPAEPAARLVLGQLLAQHGRVDEAGAEFERVLRAHPDIAIGWWMQARLRRQTPQSNHVPDLKALIGRPGLPADDIAVLARALHKELDDIGDHEGAWQALETMCTARRATVDYDPAETRALVDALIAWSASPSDAAPCADAAPGAGRVPVFIVGMHRSGTTLLEQLLDASPQVRGLGELTDFTSVMRHATDHYCPGAIDAAIVARAGGVDFAEAGRRYLQGIEWRLGSERCFIDKLPSNFLAIGFICRALPQARIVHMVRDPVATCFSNLRELFSGINPHSWDQLELAAYHREYRRLMAHWHASFPGRILDVDYARLTTDPEATMREVAAFCGIDYVEGMRSTGSSGRAVSTASSIQVRGGVSSRDVPAWAPYAGHLKPMIEALDGSGERPDLDAA